MENTRAGWRELLEPLPPEAEIALEVSTSGYFAMSILEEAGWRDRAHWVHTAGIDSLRKQKYDRLDAKRLARKLSVAERDPLPEAWFPPPAIRALALRLRARQRCWLAVLRTQVKNRLQSLLQMHGLRPTVTDVFGTAGRTWLAVARRLARCVYGVLKSGGNYQEVGWGRRPTGVVRSLEQTSRR